MLSTTQTITTNTAVLTLEQDFIRIKFYDTEHPFDLAEAKRQFTAAAELAKGKRYKVLIDVRDVNVSPNKEAQEFLSNVKEKLAEAILVTNFATRLISRFYMRKSVNNPVRIFSKEQKAINWLKKI